VDHVQTHAHVLLAHLDQHIGVLNYVSIHGGLEGDQALRTLSQPVEVVVNEVLENTSVATLTQTDLYLVILFVKLQRASSLQVLCRKRSITLNLCQIENVSIVLFLLEGRDKVIVDFQLARKVLHAVDDDESVWETSVLMEGYPVIGEDGIRAGGVRVGEFFHLQSMLALGCEQVLELLVALASGLFTRVVDLVHEGVVARTFCI